MKKLILLALLSTLVFANSLSITGGALSYHDDDSYDYNSTHNWIGLKYTHDFYNNFYFNTEIANFKNSYYDNTKMLTIGVSWLPIKIDKLKIGIAIDAGYQKGYCMDGFTSRECMSGDSNESAILIPSIEFQYNIYEQYDLGLNLSVDNNAVMGRFYLTLFRW